MTTENEIGRILKYSLFMTEKPGEHTMEMLAVRCGYGQIVDPRRVYRCVCEYRRPASREEAVKLYNVVLNLMGSDADHIDIVRGSDIIWEYMDNN